MPIANRIPNRESRGIVKLNSSSPDQSCWRHIYVIFMGVKHAAVRTHILREGLPEAGQNFEGRSCTRIEVPRPLIHFQSGAVSDHYSRIRVARCIVVGRKSVPQKTVFGWSTQVASARQNRRNPDRVFRDGCAFLAEYQARRCTMAREEKS